jgi:DtxR family transcriptional regulator, manganese transport regulator
MSPRYTRLESIRNANHAKKEESSTSRKEDYLEVIYELIQYKGYAITIDISEYLNVSSPSVTYMIQRLNNSGHLNYEKYRGIRLTDKGILVAKNIGEKHDLLAEFLKIIGVDEDTANKDTEGIEHHLQPKTLEKLDHFINNIRKKRIVNTK